MAGYEWQRIKLYGPYWWDGSGSDAQKEERATKRNKESEENLTALLEDGWQIVSIVQRSPRGFVLLAHTGFADLMQEAWSVFLQRSRQ
jgi:hypothetical protein